MNISNSKFIFILGSLVILTSAYLPQLNQSLWLDEFASYHATQGTLRQAFQFRWQELFISPIYFSSVWISSRIFGVGEWALRMPTLVFGLLAVFYLFQVANKLGNRQVGAYSVLIFLSFPQTIAHFTFSRPYSLGVFCALLSIYSWLQWVNYGRTRDGELSVLAFVAAIYSHITFVTVGLVLAVILLSIKKEANCRFQLFCFGLFGFILLYPLLHITTEIWTHKNYLSLAGTGLSFERAVADLLGPQLLAALVAIAIFACRFGLRTVSNFSSFRRVAIILIVWTFGPWIVVYSIFSVAGSSVLPVRYLLVVYPAISIIIALGISALKSNFARCVTIIFTISTGIYSYTKIYQPRQFEDWRAALAFIKPLLSDPNSIFLFYSGWPETNQIERLRKTPFDTGMLAPLHYYGVKNLPIFVPYNPALGASQEYLSQSLKLVSGPKRRLVLLSCFSIAPYYPILAKYSFTAAWHIVDESRFGNVMVVVLEELAPNIS